MEEWKKGESWIGQRRHRREGRRREDETTISDVVHNSADVVFGAGGKAKKKRFKIILYAHFTTVHSTAQPGITTLGLMVDSSWAREREKIIALWFIVTTFLEHEGKRHRGKSLLRLFGHSPEPRVAACNEPTSFPAHHRSVQRERERERWWWW